MKSMETTVAGVIAAIAMALNEIVLPIVDQDPLTTPDWGTVATILGLLGLGIAARSQRQHNKDNSA